MVDYEIFIETSGKHPSYYGVGIDSDDEEDECRATHAMLKTYPANFTDNLWVKNSKKLICTRTLLLLSISTEMMIKEEYLEHFFLS